MWLMLGVAGGRSLLGATACVFTGVTMRSFKPMPNIPLQGRLCHVFTVRVCSRPSGDKMADTHEGWLRKRGKVNTAFKTRWMVLRDGRLDYFAVQGATNVHKGSIGLSGGAVVEEGKAGSWQINVTSGARTYILEARNEAEYTEWLRALSAAVASTANDAFTPASFSESDRDSPVSSPRKQVSSTREGDDGRQQPGLARRRSVLAEELGGLNLHGNAVPSASSPVGGAA